jgi:hypothetical protein
VRTVEFRVEREELGIGEDDVVSIYVDDIPLRDLARHAELPYASAEGRPDLAGQYAGLLAGPDILWPSRHFLGEPVLHAGGRTYLLGCVCGFADCWNLTARITLARGTVAWSDWATGHRDWDLTAIGTLTFGRGQYEHALRAAA